MKITVDENIELQSLSPEHAKELFLLTEENRPHLRDWLPWLDRVTEEKNTLGFIKMTMDQANNKNGHQFAIFYQGKIAGVIGQHKINWDNKTTSIGYWLSKKYSGKGVISNSCRGLIDYSFDELDLNVVEIGAAVENHKSRAIPERLGFTLEGVLRQREWLYDRYVDHAIYSVLKSEWKK